MKMISCPNCQKLAGYKRSLGFGTLFAVIFTAGLWLFAIPFYPKRCLTCGLSEAESVPWYRMRSTIFVLIVGAGLLVVAIVGWIQDSQQSPAVIIDNRYAAYPQTLGRLPQTQSAKDAPVSRPLAVPEEQGVRRPTYKVEQITTQYDDNEVRAESLFLDKPVTLWGVVGRLSTSAFGGADVSFDEGFPRFGGGPQSFLDCSVDEDQTPSLQELHRGSIVVMYAEGGRKVGQTVFFTHCRLERVVPLSLFAGDPMLTHLPTESSSAGHAVTSSGGSNGKDASAPTDPAQPGDPR